ncbi:MULTISPECIES: hypothetical protein [unclassified Wolbachia]|uniref:hypothetical protein n=1 Tax=unclassified Wolbachia TaxID=2640676 RepID=UPI0022327583|nr:hypothetical protein [Wolbachia endosymbiont (group A) of Epistrophe grossularia]
MTLESRKLNFTPGNKNWIPVSSTGMTAILRHTAIHSIAVRTLSSRRVSSQRPYDVIPVLDTGI